MARKKSEPIINPIETYVKEVVDKVLSKRNDELKEEDAQQIIKAILPEIEKIVAGIVLNIPMVYFQSKFLDRLKIIRANVVRIMEFQNLEENVIYVESILQIVMNVEKDLQK